MGKTTPDEMQDEEDLDVEKKSRRAINKIEEEPDPSDEEEESLQKTLER